MRNFKIIISVAFISLLMISCKNETPQEVLIDKVEATQAKKDIASNATIAKAEFTMFMDKVTKLCENVKQK